MHAVGTRALLRYMGIRPVGDPDVTLTSHDFFDLVRGTNVSEAHVNHLGEIYQHVRGEGFRRFLLRDDRNQPAYWFCPLCLAGDEIPYLRVNWRFADWKICPEHHIRMCCKCIACQASFPAMRPARKFYISDLRLCSNCATDLTSHPLDPIACDETDALTRTQRALANAFLLGHCFIKGRPDKIPVHNLATVMPFGQVIATRAPRSRTPQFRVRLKKGR